MTRGPLSMYCAVFKFEPNGPSVMEFGSGAASRSTFAQVHTSGSTGRFVLSGLAGSLYFPRPCQFLRRPSRMRAEPLRRSQREKQRPTAFSHQVENVSSTAIELFHTANGNVKTHAALHSRTFNPFTRLNSAAFPVTSVAFKFRACAAMSKSSGPIILPTASNSARISA